MAVATLREYQLYYIPERNNLASWSVDTITEHAVSGEWNLFSNFQAYLMPFTLSCSVLQEGIAFVCNVVLFVVGKETEEPIFVSLGVIVNLVKATVMAIFIDIGYIFLRDPTIYKRERPIPPPPPPPKTVEDVLEEIPLGGVSRYEVEKANELFEGTGVSFSISTREEKPEGCDSYICAPVAFKADRRKKDDQRTVLEKPSEEKLAFKQVEIKNFDDFLYPEGTFSLTANTHLSTLKRKCTDVDALVLSNQTELSFLKTIGERELEGLSRVRVLAVKGRRTVQAEELEAIAKKFRRMAALDLREVTVEGTFSEDFLENYIVVCSDKENANEHLKLFNQELEGVIRTFVKGECQAPHELIALFKRKRFSSGKEERSSPVLSFVTRFIALRGLPIGGTDMHEVIKALRDNFDSLTYLDFSQNPLLDANAMCMLTELNLSTLKLRQCVHAYHTPGAKKDEWLPSYETFSAAIIGVFGAGAEVVDLQHMRSKTVSKYCSTGAIHECLTRLGGTTGTERKIYYSYFGRLTPEAKKEDWKEVVSLTYGKRKLGSAGS